MREFLLKFTAATRLYLLLMILSVPSVTVGQIETTTVNPDLEAYSAAGLPNPTVTSDKEDYAPGEIAIITGIGWTLDSTVDIHLEEEPSHDHHHGYHGTVVDANGNWRIEYPIEVRHIGVKFTVVVDGVQSKYQGLAYFTDANFEFSAIGLPSGTPNSTLITVRYNINGGTQRLSQFEYNKGSNPRIAVKENEMITYLYDNIVINGAIYSAPGGSEVGTANEGVRKIESTYSLSCMAPSISSQPLNNSVIYGANTIFSVAASGTVAASPSTIEPEVT